MADSNCDSQSSLSRALSQTSLQQIEFNDISPTATLQRHPTRMRRLSKCSSVENGELLTSPYADESRVLVINTGGTIGMTLHDNVLAPEANALVQRLRKLPILHDDLYAQQTCMHEYYGHETLVLPKSTPHHELQFPRCRSNW